LLLPLFGKGETLSPSRRQRAKRTEKEIPLPERGEGGDRPSTKKSPVLIEMKGVKGRKPSGIPNFRIVSRKERGRKGGILNYMKRTTQEGRGYCNIFCLPQEKGKRAELQGRKSLKNDRRRPSEQIARKKRRGGKD